MNGEEAEDDPEAEFDDEDYRENDVRGGKKSDEQLSVTSSGHGIPFAKSTSTSSSGSDTDDR